ncbi:MAG TPA: hypothetical protein VL098_03935 [Flavipsychrobacter sp.]|nr:hypothetical protein [Flavipsychrobacter sp.]
MSVLVIRNPTGRQLTDITSLALVGGVAFGEFYLQLATLMFDRDTIANARGFGEYYVGASPEVIYEQYCNINSIDRAAIERLETPITRSVYGLSIGISTGGSIDAIADALERPVRRGLVMLQRQFRLRFWTFIRRRLLDLAGDTIDISAGAAGDRLGLTTGVSGGIISSIDGGILRGANGYSNFSLDASAVSRSNFAIIQLGGGFVVGAGINLLFIGNFPSLASMISSIGSVVDSVFTTSLDDSLFMYMGNVLSHAQCFAFVGDAAAGAILPGIDLNIIAS